MKRPLSKANKIIIGLTLATLTLLTLIAATVKYHHSTPKKYDLECVTNYVKAPLQECVAKEAE